MKVYKPGGPTPDSLRDHRAPKSTFGEIPGVEQMFRAPDPLAERRRMEEAALDGVQKRSAELFGKMSGDEATARLASASSALEATARLATTLDAAAKTRPLTNAEKLRLQKRLEALDRNVEGLAVAVGIIDEAGGADAIAALERLGQSRAAMSLALGSLEYTLDLPGDPHRLLSRKLSDAIMSCETCRDAAFTVWDDDFIPWLKEAAQAAIDTGRGDLARRYVEYLGSLTKRPLYRVMAAKIEIEDHLAKGNVFAAKKALGDLKFLRERAKTATFEALPDRPFGFESSTIDGIDALIAGLQAEVDGTVGFSVLDHIEGMRVGEPSALLTKTLARGRALVPHEVHLAVSAYAHANQRLEEARFAVWDPDPSVADAARDGYPRLRDEVTATRRAASEAMFGVMMDLRSKGLGREEADNLAGTIAIDPEIDRMEAMDIRDIAAGFFRLTGGRGAATTHYFTRVSDTASAGYGSIDVGRSVRFSSIVHELGHHVEYSAPELNAAAAEWVRHRAGTKTPSPMNALFTEAEHEAHDGEVGFRPDKPFVSPYVGRVYETGGTEVLSIGFEMLINPGAAVELLATDPEHFYLVMAAAQP